MHPQPEEEPAVAVLHAWPMTIGNASLNALIERLRLTFLFAPPQTWKGGNEGQNEITIRLAKSRSTKIHKGGKGQNENQG